MKCLGGQGSVQELGGLPAGNTHSQAHGEEGDAETLYRPCHGCGCVKTADFLQDLYKTVLISYRTC